MTYRVYWGLGRHEDFPTWEQAQERKDAIYVDLTEKWPILANTNDAVLPRIREVEEHNTGMDPKA